VTASSEEYPDVHSTDYRQTASRETGSDRAIIYIASLERQAITVQASNVLIVSFRIALTRLSDHGLLVAVLEGLVSAVQFGGDIMRSSNGSRVESDSRGLV
jgi:hypothetical protein